MIWRKLGCIFEVNAENRTDWMYSHCSNPTPLYLGNNIFRIFFSTRDTENKSNVGYFDIDIENYTDVIRYSKEPVFLHGEIGSIDESGIGIGNILLDDEGAFMYYMAWQTPPEDHWRGDIAKAKLLNGFELMEKGENNLVLGIGGDDQSSLSYPFVLKDEDGYHMWYGSTETWEYGNGEMLHIIKHAYSKDGLTWNRTGVCIDYKIGESQAFSRPCVLKDNEKGFHMWYSYRGNSDKYKIGYAFSDYGKNWDTYNDTRNVISASSSGWDSEMVCYPYIFKHNNKLYMLYNGNGYGKTGIGLAIME